METSRNLFLFWPEAYKKGPGSAGGKGWNLARLDRYGFRIPAGGVLSAEAYQVFITENSLLPVIEELSRTLAADAVGTKLLNDNLLTIRNIIEASSVPPRILENLFAALEYLGILDKPLAIRSSATMEDSSRASFAGVHDSFLNVRGREDIVVAIKRCYVSIWTPRAVSYRLKMGFSHEEVIPAIAVMEMVNAAAAGVAFSCDPATGREDILVVNANFGLGESVVNGSTEPDEYRLDSGLRIQQKRIGRKNAVVRACAAGGTELVESSGAAAIQVLSDPDIHKLGSLVQRVYDSLGSGEQHQDIEWAFDGRDLILVQARPVTSLPRYTFEALKNQPDIWSNANLRDSMPMVQSALNWSFSQQMPQGFDYNLFGLNHPPGIRSIRLFKGRAYFNLSLQQWIFFDAFGIAPKQINETLGGYQPEIDIDVSSPYCGIKGLKRLTRVLKLLGLSRQAKKNAPQAFNKVDQLWRTILNEEPGKTSYHALLAKYDLIKICFEEFTPVLFACNFAADMNPLVKTLEKYFPGQGIHLTNALMAGRGHITSAEQGYRLLELAEMARDDEAARSFFSQAGIDYTPWESELPEGSIFKLAFRRFLAEFGHRGVYEMDIINPRWAEDPTYLLNYIAGSFRTADSGAVKKRQKETAGKAWQIVRQKVSPSQCRKVQHLADKAVQGMELREAAKSELVKLYGCMRRLARDIGLCLTEHGILTDPADVYHCTWNELKAILDGNWDGQGLHNLIADRKMRKKELEALSPPDYFVDEAPHSTFTAAGESGNVLQGIGVSAGQASGNARVLDHPHQVENLLTGEVLIAHSTDPGWTPLFLKSSAIIVETGGFGSHGSIVAREYGIPMVANIPGAARIIKSGQHLVVDGSSGKVLIQ